MHCWEDAFTASSRSIALWIIIRLNLIRCWSRDTCWPWDTTIVEVIGVQLWRVVLKDVLIRRLCRIHSWVEVVVSLVALVSSLGDRILFLHVLVLEFLFFFIAAHLFSNGALQGFPLSFPCRSDDTRSATVDFDSFFACCCGCRFFIYDGRHIANLDRWLYCCRLNVVASLIAKVLPRGLVGKLVCFLANWDLAWTKGTVWTTLVLQITVFFGGCGIGWHHVQDVLFVFHPEDGSGPLATTGDCALIFLESCPFVLLFLFSILIAAIVTVIRVEDSSTLGWVFSGSQSRWCLIARSCRLVMVQSRGVVNYGGLDVRFGWLTTWFELRWALCVIWKMEIVLRFLTEFAHSCLVLSKQNWNSLVLHFMHFLCLVVHVPSRCEHALDRLLKTMSWCRVACCCGIFETLLFVKLLFKFVDDSLRGRRALSLRCICWWFTAISILCMARPIRVSEAALWFLLQHSWCLSDRLMNRAAHGPIRLAWVGVRSSRRAGLLASRVHDYNYLNNQKLWKI